MVDFGETPSQQITALVVILNRAIPLFIAGLAVADRLPDGAVQHRRRGPVPARDDHRRRRRGAVNLPGPLHVVMIIVVAMRSPPSGPAIVAVLKVTRGVSEVISSIMLNYVALGLAGYLITGPFRGARRAATSSATSPIPE